MTGAVGMGTAICGGKAASAGSLALVDERRGYPHVCRRSRTDLAQRRKYRLRHLRCRRCRDRAIRSSRISASAMLVSRGHSTVRSARGSAFAGLEDVINVNLTGAFILSQAFGSAAAQVRFIAHFTVARTLRRSRHCYQKPVPKWHALQDDRGQQRPSGTTVRYSVLSIAREDSMSAHSTPIRRSPGSL